LQLDCPAIVRDGAQILFLATGPIVNEALQACRQLEERGIRPAVAVMAHLPFEPGPALIETLTRFEMVLTVEEGFTSGGLGSLAGEAIARHGLRCRLRTCGVSRNFGAASGSQAWYRRRHGLDAASLAEAAIALTRGKEE
jgi:transketolase